MKFNKKTIGAILLLGILIIATSCKRQNVSEIKSNSAKDTNSTNTKGTLISKMDNNLMVVFQDRHNNYWFGSKDQGLYQYDGKSITHYTVKDGLCSDLILGIQEDQSANLYFDTPVGVSKFDGQIFTTLTVVDGNASGNDWKLAPDDLWFRMGWDKKGPYRYDGKTLYHLEFPKNDQADEFYAKYPNVSYSPYGIYTLYKDRKGAIWMGTSSLGLCRYDGKSISWLYEQQLTETPNGGSFGIRSIIETQDGYFWFCNTRYRYEILPDTNKTPENSKINYRKENGMAYSKENGAMDYPYFMSIVEDDSGDLWMASYNEGVWRNNGKELLHYPVKNGETTVLLSSIYKDHQGVLWLGTQNDGAYTFNGTVFEKFNPTIGDK